VLCSIADSIISPPYESTLSSEVRKHFQNENSIATAMCTILNLLDEGETEEVASWLIERADGLKQSGEGYGMEMEFEKVLDIFNVEDDEDEDE
jgi:hypothetical protein